MPAVARRAAMMRLVRAARGWLLLAAASLIVLRQWSLINFTPVEQRVKFETLLEEAERHALKLSSRLVAVARNVRRGPV